VLDCIAKDHVLRRRHGYNQQRKLFSLLLTYNLKQITAKKMRIATVPEKAEGGSSSVSCRWYSSRWCRESADLVRSIDGSSQLLGMALEGFAISPKCPSLLLYSHYFAKNLPLFLQIKFR
jgi:hypothetical protein